MKLVILTAVHDYSVDDRVIFHCDGCHELTQHDKPNGKYICSECNYPDLKGNHEESYFGNVPVSNPTVSAIHPR